ncbi:glycogen debranching N-terminal domain-containing protein [Arthrobacter sp. 92]|jgi:glycogen debranching enzyme|uniref:amylo-alpha-1,6-glucosidase n=1 Tax=Arthrobacter sp. 92 TaxID=3418175 RepID=UPI003D00FB51
MTGWNADTGAGPLGEGAVTVVDGSSFCISSANGDMHPERPHGVFFEDTRFISRWNLLVNDGPVEPLSSRVHEPFRALFVGRAKRSDGRADSPLVVERERVVGAGIREDITVRNYSREPAVCSIGLTVETDFADLFEVKDGRARITGQQSRTTGPGSLTIESTGKGAPRRVTVRAPDASFSQDELRYMVVIPPRSSWSRRIVVTPGFDAGESADPFSREVSAASTAAAKRYQEWSEFTPVLHVEDEGTERILGRSRDDLGSLRIFDPKHPGRAVLAAGTPWFMALFGRDALLTSYMTMLVDPSLALGTLRTLAELQGTTVNPLTEEEPGRIPHEVRHGATMRLALSGGNAYYGTADATPLFVTLLGEVSRWGLGTDILRSLLPNADRALDWITQFGDRDGDGFVEYARATDRGLINQGWKDSWDGINFADGGLAEAPIALCEVQGYVYSAFISRAVLALDTGDPELAEHWRKRAATLKKRFNELFWLPDRGYYAVALDRHKRPVDACTSNMGHCLWSGIVDDEKAPLVAERLMSQEMFSGWGIRTLASDMGAFNPVSYHNGSVWPHDNALIAAGLMRHGFVKEAQRVASAMLEAADYFDGRLPELFCGFDRRAYAQPVPYPTACSPQAWAAGTPVLLMRILLRLDPYLTTNDVWLAPVFPKDFGDFEAHNVPIGTSHVSIRVSRGEVTIEGLPPGIRLHREARSPLADIINHAGSGPRADTGIASE